MIHSVRRAVATCLILVLGALAPLGSLRAETSTETMVFLRHGEKPAADLGQLDCQGLNRALALPWVLMSRYGNAKFIFAPNPGQQVEAQGHFYNYVRPLATIEPTAVALGLPVDTRFGYKDVEALKRELLQPAYRKAIVFVAWEHHMLVKAVRDILARAGGDPQSVPEWKDEDFDSLYVLTLTDNDGKLSAAFSHQQENLNGRSTSCS